MTLILNINLLFPKIHCWHQFEDPSWNPSLVRAVMLLDGSWPMTSKNYFKFANMILIFNSNLIYPKMQYWHQFEDPSWYPSLVRTVMLSSRQRQTDWWTYRQHYDNTFQPGMAYSPWIWTSHFLRCPVEMFLH